MAIKKISDELVNEVKQALKQNPKVIAAYVLGSVIENRDVAGSDFDLAVIVKNSQITTYENIHKLLGRINFPRDLDLSVVDKKSSPLFLFQVISKGEKIYEKSNKEVVGFESFVMKNYYDTAHMRNIYNSYLKSAFA